MTDNLPITPSESENLPIAQHPAHGVDELITMWLAETDVRDNSKELYGRCVTNFFKWVATNNIPHATLARETILSYKKHLTDRGLSSATVGVNILSLRLFFKWTASKEGSDRGVLFRNIATNIKGNKRQGKFKKMHLTLDELHKWLIWFEKRDSTHAKRDLALANIMARTGMRTIEIIRANVDDIVMRSGRRVLLVHGKGRSEKDDFVVLTDKCFKSIAAYILFRKNEGERIVAGDPLFVSDSDRNYKGRLTTRSIRRIAKEGLRGIGLDDPIYSAHSIRHTAAVHILQQGGGVQKAQEVLRHADPGTTQIYLESIKEEERLKNSGEDLLDVF